MELNSAAPTKRSGAIHVPVASSSLASVGYRAHDRVLEVRFQRGEVYQYLDVPEHVFGSLLAADSKGRYFNQAVRNCFEYRRP
jgi:hypothetical protein